MIPLTLTGEERNILRGVLDYDLSELHRELADTDNWKFKEGLKKKEAVLVKVLDVLSKIKKAVELELDLTPKSGT